MKEENTYKIKEYRDEIPLSLEWIAARKLSAAVGNEAKFKQHRFLMEALLSTGDTHLIEGTTSSFWGGGARYESPAYDLGDIHGKDHQGLILEDIRENERTARKTQ